MYYQQSKSISELAKIKNIKEKAKVKLSNNNNSINSPKNNEVNQADYEGKINSSSPELNNLLNNNLHLSEYNGIIEPITVDILIAGSTIEFEKNTTPKNNNIIQIDSENENDEDKHQKAILIDPKDNASTIEEVNIPHIEENNINSTDSDQNNNVQNNLDNMQALNYSIADNDNSDSTSIDVPTTNVNDSLPQVNSSCQNSNPVSEDPQSISDESASIGQDSHTLSEDSSSLEQEDPSLHTGNDPPMRHNFPFNEDNNSNPNQFNFYPNTPVALKDKMSDNVDNVGNYILDDDNSTNHSFSESISSQPELVEINTNITKSEEMNEKKSNNQIEKWKVNDCKEWLKSNNLSTKGNKKELINRILSTNLL